MNLSELPADLLIELTPVLQRLFTYAGCDPTICHACGQTINIGEEFRLIPHNGIDEMCCVLHGKKRFNRQGCCYEIRN